MSVILALSQCTEHALSWISDTPPETLPLLDAPVEQADFRELSPRYPWHYGPPFSEVFFSPAVTWFVSFWAFQLCWSVLSIFSLGFLLFFSKSTLFL